MNKNVDISLAVALRSGVQLALKYIQRLFVVIGIVTLSILVMNALSVLLMFFVAQISTDRNVLMATYAALFVLSGIIVHGFILWYFKEILRIVRGHTRSFPELKKSFTRGWQLFVAQMLFYFITYAIALLLAYPLITYFALSGTPLIGITALSLIPALCLAARFCLYPFFLADGKGALDSLRASFMITHKHVLKLIPLAAARMSVFSRTIIVPFMGAVWTIPSFFRVGLYLIMFSFLGAIFDLAAAHIYQRLTHPDQAAVPPGVQPLD